MANAGKPVDTRSVNFQRYDLGEPIVSMRHNRKSDTFYALGAFSFFWKGRDDPRFNRHPILSRDNSLETCRSFEYVPGQFLCVTIYNYASSSTTKMYIKSLRYPGPERFETRFGGLVKNMPNHEHSICADNLGRVYLLDVPTGNIVRTQDFRSFQVDEYLTKTYKQVPLPGHEIQNIKIGEALDEDLNYSAFIGTTAAAIVVHNGKATPIDAIAFHDIRSTVNYAWDGAHNRLFAYFDFLGADTARDAERRVACRVRLDDGAIQSLSGRTPFQYPLLYPNPIMGYRSCPIAAASRDQKGAATDTSFYVVAKDGDNYKVMLQCRADGFATDIPALPIINSMYQHDGILYVGTDTQILAYRESDLFDNPPAPHSGVDR